MRMVNKFNSCGPLKPYLWDYAAGMLQTAADVARIDAHLVGCGACRAEVEGFRAAAAAMAAYAAAPEAGIPPRAPDWDAVQARIVETERSRVPARPRVSWLQAMRTSPAFAGSVLSLSICTTLCAVAIPWALEDKQAREARAELLRTSAAPVPMPSPESVDTTPAFSAAIKGPVEMVVRPVFSDSSNGFFAAGMILDRTYPLAVTLVNRTGRSARAQLSVVHGGALSVRHYERSVQLSADTEPQTVFLYPYVDSWDNSRPELKVTLSGPFRSQEVRLSRANYLGSNGQMALIGDAGSSALLPKRQKFEEYLRQLNRSSNVLLRNRMKGRRFSVCSSAIPELAPDRPVGYESIDTVVLGHGAERLRDEQKAALRQWVISGGSVILLPGSRPGMLGILPDAPFKSASPVSELPSGTPLRRYRLGLGTALTVGVDLTESRFRERWELPLIWDELRGRAAPAMSLASMNESAMSRTSNWKLRYDNPFQVALPPLSTVVYLFTGYFLLAVPVTFVVLKRTRRMNWAWVTGPTLAAVFGAAVYGFTADLHKAKLSRRTGGIIISIAGEKKARFTGTSELFFPSAGRYDLVIPNAETIEFGPRVELDPYGNDTGQVSSHNSSGRSGIMLRSLYTRDNGTSVSAPGLAVPNLAFRRLRHAQPVEWGEGITTDLELTPDGRVVGTIRNGTGRTLSNICILLQTSTKKAEIKDGRPYQRTYRNLVLLNLAVPGVTKVNRPVSRVINGSAAINNSLLFHRGGSAPMLIATTSGEGIGPAIGQDVGGSEAVTVAVTLPEIRSTAKMTVNGGPK